MQSPLTYDNSRIQKGGDRQMGPAAHKESKTGAGRNSRMKGDVMAKQKLALALILAGLSAIAQRAAATPGIGVTPSYKVVSSNVNINAQTMADKLLLLTFDSDKNPINILNVHQTFAPGGYSGWHTHSGPGIVIVEQGTITIEETEGCFVDYPQGSVLFEGGPGHIHNASNRTGTPVILDAYFFLPAFDPPGGNSRVDEPVQTGECK